MVMRMKRDSHNAHSIRPVCETMSFRNVAKVVCFDGQKETVQDAYLNRLHKLEDRLRWPIKCLYKPKDRSLTISLCP